MNNGNSGIRLTGVTTTGSARGFTTRYAGGTEARRRPVSNTSSLFSREDVARIWRRAEASTGAWKVHNPSPPCAKFAPHWSAEFTEGEKSSVISVLSPPCLRAFVVNLNSRPDKATPRMRAAQ